MLAETCARAEGRQDHARKSPSSAGRCHARRARLAERRLFTRKFGPAAHSQSKVILESPGNTRVAGQRAASSRRALASEANRQFNTVPTVMSNRLNPTNRWVNLRESQFGKSRGRAKKTL